MVFECLNIYFYNVDIKRIYDLIKSIPLIRVMPLR